MVKISVDEADAFDRLAIGKIKCQVCVEQNGITEAGKLFNAYFKLYDELLVQYGTELFVKIVSSEEYQNTISANKKLFDLIDLSKTKPMSASTLDKANFERFKAKRSLQEKFFKNSLTEAKIGYGNY